MARFRYSYLVVGGIAILLVQLLQLGAQEQRYLQEVRRGVFG